MKKLILIDGSSYLYRAFHALPPLMTSKGEPTGAIYGVVNMIKKMVDDYKPEYIAVVFDSKEKNFRHELYPQYKATRPAMDKDLQVQIQPLHDILRALGLPIIVVDGVEADDVIGTLAVKSAQHDLKVLISTGDKDMAQLVNNKITLLNTMSNTVLDEIGVKKKFGVTAERITDYLTLVGDSSDNIPGVSGVGPKTAVKWLEQYDSLDNIIKNAAEIKGKVGDNLRLSLDQFALTKQLVTIKCDLDLNLKLSDFVRSDADQEKLDELFTRFEFKNWLSKKTVPSQPSVYTCIRTEEEFAKFYQYLESADCFALDLETTSLDIITAQIVGLSFAVKAGEAFYIPVAHDYENAPVQLKLDWVLEKLKPIFLDENKTKLGQNLKYDMSVLVNYNIDLAGVGYDTMLESYIVNSSINKHDKESLALRYLGKSILTYEAVSGVGTKQIPFNKVAVDIATSYAASDADLVLQFHEVLWPQIIHNKQEQIFKNIEMPLVKVLSRMERCGVCVDEKLLQKLSQELAVRIDILAKKVYEEAQEEFNISSPLQLQEILYNKLKLPVLQKTPTGQPSTAEAVLQELALEYSLPKIILEYRSLSKLKSTYTDALPQQINSLTGRIHTSYNQAVTTTGRLSSTNPNLQNIPNRTEEGRKIREAFIAPSNCKIIAADYSQVELRIMAHFSQDENLCKAFLVDADIHKATAAEIFDVPLESVTNIQRRNAKAINFGLIYGMSAFGLAKKLGMSRDEAQKYIELYFARYPGVKNYMEKMRAFAHENGFVETLFGHRLNIPDIKAKNFIKRAAAERMAINAPMQGSAAEIMKIAMINIDSWIKQCDFKINMIMQVHDELVFEVDVNHVEQAIIEITSKMENAANLSIPLIVSVGVGDNWEKAH